MIDAVIPDTIGGYSRSNALPLVVKFLQFEAGCFYRVELEKIGVELLCSHD